MPLPSSVSSSGSLLVHSKKSHTPHSEIFESDDSESLCCLLCCSRALWILRFRSATVSSALTRTRRGTPAVLARHFACKQQACALRTSLWCCEPCNKSNGLRFMDWGLGLCEMGVGPVDTIETSLLHCSDCTLLHVVPGPHHFEMVHRQQPSPAHPRC